MGTINGNIKEELILLAELQQTDIEITGLEKELAGVEAQLQGLDEQLTLMLSQVEAGRTRVAELQKQYRQDDAEIHSIEDTIAKTQAKLNSVKTNKEYQAMLKAIDDLKLKNSDLEDTMLAALEEIEAAETQRITLEADRDDLTKEINGQKLQIKKRAEEQQHKIDLQQADRENTWQQLSPKLQLLYQRTVQQGKGIGVAAVVEAVCQACRVNLPPQLFIDLMRMRNMFQCPNCQRIMYPNTIWDNENKQKVRSE